MLIKLISYQLKTPKRLHFNKGIKRAFNPPLINKELRVKRCIVYL